MLNFLTKIKYLAISPIILLSKYWHYNYQDLRIIFEQSNILHCYFITANQQRLMAKMFISAVCILATTFVGLILHNSISAWQYKKLEISKLQSDKKRQEALTALNVLAEDPLSNYKKELTQNQLIDIAHLYRERSNNMQTIVEFSSSQLNQAKKMLEQGLIASGIQPNNIKRVKLSSQSNRYAIGGISKEYTLDDKSSDALEAYKLNLSEYEAMKKIYHSLPKSLPVKNALISSQFGLRVHPITNKLTIHEGADFQPSNDVFAKSALAGVVESVRLSNSGYGNMVVLLHENNVRTLYAHLDSISVKPKQNINQGEVLGRIGNTGASTGRHLHYEVSINNIKVNPLIITAMAKNVQ
ncbi:MAG: M23 family metallopeptidase [Methylotenera sp.]|uniref:M23 family metallopeptidase n=1 Tax=Methylotenera sp. TaxID=2051956 RepID=UPI00271FE306|nr:M23 family metallopeptidase [Methylotenera sp.]MDO9149933.1 M23 family metallopeptidase [Methylotenera sp.]